jgi:hypothetical protein
MTAGEKRDEGPGIMGAHVAAVMPAGNNTLKWPKKHAPSGKGTNDSPEDDRQDGIRPD